MPPGKKPGSNRGLLIGLILAGVIALAGVVGGTVLVVTGGDDSTTATDDRGDTAPTDEPSDSPTDSPSEDPSDSPSASPTSPSAPPSSSAPPVASGSKFSYKEFDGDWDFKFGNTKLQATFRKGWDYDSCDPVQVDGKMDALGCVRASEWTYRAQKGRLALTHIVYTMKSEKAATKAAKKGVITPTSWKSQPDAFVENVTTGMWRAKSTGEFVVLTLETHQKSVNPRLASDYLSYANVDIASALLFR